MSLCAFSPLSAWDPYMNSIPCMFRSIFCITICQLHDGAPASNIFQHSFITEVKNETVLDKTSFDAALNNTLSKTLRWTPEARLADTQKAHERRFRLL